MKAREDIHAELQRSVDDRAAALHRASAGTSYGARLQRVRRHQEALAFRSRRAFIALAAMV